MTSPSTVLLTLQQLAGLTPDVLTLSSKRTLERFARGLSDKWDDFQRALDVVVRAEIASERCERQRMSAEVVTAYKKRQQQTKYGDPESQEVLRKLTENLLRFRAELEHLKAADAGGGEFWFREVSRFDIKSATEAAALRALKRAHADLGITCDIRWVRPELAELGRRDQYKTAWPPVYKSDSDFTGQAWLLSGFVLLKHNLTPAETARTVLHEARHLADAKYGAQPRTAAEREQWEARALAYERWAYTALDI